MPDRTSPGEMERVLVDADVALRLCEMAVYYNDEPGAWECTECGEQGESIPGWDGGGFSIEHADYCPLPSILRRAGAKADAE